jgi:Fe2+ or Zn2+ uptake regulation protein
MERKWDLVSTIRRQGRRLTRQRQLVLEVLEESQGHLDVETLYEQIRKRDQQIGIATVYRTLAFLKEIGLVEEHQFGEDHGHFETVQGDRLHYHFTCINCGRVVEFQAPEVMKLAHKLCESQGLQVTDLHLYLSGYCAQCHQPGKSCVKAKSFGEG